MQSSFKSEIGGHCYSMPMWFGDNAKPVLMHMLLDICCIFDIFWTSCTSFFFFCWWGGNQLIVWSKVWRKTGNKTLNWHINIQLVFLCWACLNSCRSLEKGRDWESLSWISGWASSRQDLMIGGPSNYGSQSLIVIYVTFKTANSQFVSCNWVFTNSKACISRSS